MDLTCTFVCGPISVLSKSGKGCEPFTFSLLIRFSINGDWLFYDSSAAILHLAAHLWANLFWSHLLFSSLCLVSLQYRHIKFMSRDPSTPTDGLRGLGVPINFLPLLLTFSVEVFLWTTYRQDIAWDIAFTSCCMLIPVAWVAFKFSISHFSFSINSVWACIFYLCCYSFSGSGSSAPFILQMS